VTSFEVTYRGPSAFALQAAALLADAPVIELTSAERADDPEAPGDAVLALTLGGTTEAVTAAVVAVQDELPAGASVILEEPGTIAPD
jgi:hypothetical protein